MTIASRTILVPAQPVIEPDFMPNIERGAALLDARFGTAWRDGVNTKALDLASTTSCVLGQVFVESIVNGATRTVHLSGAHYWGGVDFLFPAAAYAHLDTANEGEHASSHHGFVVREQDVDTYNAQHGTEHSLTSMYEVLTAQWVEFLEGSGA